MWQTQKSLFLAEKLNRIIAVKTHVKTSILGRQECGECALGPVHAVRAKVPRRRPRRCPGTNTEKCFMQSLSNGHSLISNDNDPDNVHFAQSNKHTVY